MAPKALTPSSKDSKGGAYGDFARRRRAHSKDEDSPSMVAQIVSSRFNTSPSKDSRSHSPMNGLLRRRNGKGRTFLSFSIIAADLLILGYAIRNITFFFSSRNNERTVEVTTLPQPEPLDITALEVPKEFEFSLPGAPVCEELKQEEVAYTLALHMSDTRLWMMQQHCALWGESAPISIAIWTSMGEEEILETLRSVGCRVDYITIGIIPSDSMSLVDYPINTLRNLALSGVATSHALVLDVDMFPSIDLFDTLNLPSVREALSNDPKLAVVVPAFQTEDLKCGSSPACLHRHLYWLPRDFEDLVIGLSTGKILPYDPTHFSRQGSTNYRGWMKQAHGELVDIPCVSSNQYQPYLVVRLCNHLPPFQPRFIGYGGNNMAWTMQLRRVGYRLQQVGGSFVAHFPHPDSQAKLESEKGSGPNENLRDRSDTTLAEFNDWLQSKVDDASRLDRCKDFQDEEESLFTKVEEA